MPRFQFSISSDAGREAGVIQSESFAEALAEISQAAPAGTTLEIGVEGFPPARYERVFSPRGDAFSWKANTLLAA